MFKKFLLLVIIMLMPCMVKAYGIENFYIDATIEKNGDILVEEYFNLDGSFNGFERIIDYKNSNSYSFDPNMTSFGGSSIHNGDGLDILEVRAVPIDSYFAFDNVGGDIFTKTTSAKKGDYGVYEVNSKTNGYSILMYNPSSYNKAFYIKYRIKNVAVKHNDVGEIGWNIVGDQLNESVTNLKVYLHIPENTNVKAWAHGPLTGEVKIIDKETVLFTLSNLRSYRAVDIRATFDLNVISESKKETYTDALDKIISYETDKAEQANYERQQKDKLIEEDIIYYLEKLEDYPIRSYYNNAKEKINKLNNIELKNKYLEQLSVLKVILDEKEEEEARNALKFALEYKKYSFYKEAKESVEILDNIEVKNELMEELLIVEKEVRKEELKKEKINYMWGTILIGIILGIAYIIYLKYIKDPKTEFNHKYFRDIPNDYSPEIVSYLFHKKNVKSATSATILDLINKKVISYEKISSKNYKLTLNEDKKENLNDIELRLIELIFLDRKSIETKNIKKQAKKNYDKFISKWNSYQKAAINNSKLKKFYDEELVNKKKKKNTNVTFIIVMIIMIIPPSIILFIIYWIIKLMIKILSTKEGTMKFIFVVLLSIMSYISTYSFISILVLQRFHNLSFIIYVIALILSLLSISLIFYSKKRTLEGAEEYKKWKALKNYLKDFGRFKEREVPDVVLWEKYLVYATLFGCSKKIINTMKVEMVDAPNYDMDLYRDLYFINNHISRTVKSSYGSARSSYNAAHSSSGSSGGFSSGGGGGGGFSSGGGSFGGGGGGGRF